MKIFPRLSLLVILQHTVSAGFKDQQSVNEYDPALQAYWIGDEKFLLEDGEFFPICSEVLFMDGSDNGRSIFIWRSAAGTCAVNSVDALNGGQITGGSSWQEAQLPEETYIEQILEHECVPASECGEIDFFGERDEGDIDLTGCSVVAQSCGRNTRKKDAVRNDYSCDFYVITLLNCPGDKDLLFNTVTYNARPRNNGVKNSKCPEFGSFNSEKLLESKYSSAQFVYTGNAYPRGGVEDGEKLDLYNTDNWGCPVWVPPQ